MEFLSLPDEILEHILSFANAEDWVRVGLSCHHLHDIAESESLWRSECQRRFGLGFDQSDLGSHATWKDAFVEARTFSFLKGKWGEAWADVSNQDNIEFDGVQRPVRKSGGWTSRKDDCPVVVRRAGHTLLRFTVYGGWSSEMRWDYYVEPVRVDLLHRTCPEHVRDLCVKRQILAIQIQRNVDPAPDFHTDKCHWFVGYLITPKEWKTRPRLPFPYRYPDIREDKSIEYKQGNWSQPAFDWD